MMEEIIIHLAASDRRTARYYLPISVNRHGLSRRPTITCSTGDVIADSTDGRSHAIF